MNPEPRGPLDPGLASGTRAVDPRLDRLAAAGRGEIVEATAHEVVTRSARAGSGNDRSRAHLGERRQPTMLGDAESVDDLAAVYRRLYPSLVRTAFLLVDTREQAEEVVQEAFAKAFPKWERLRTPDAYVRTCVVNDADVTAASALLERFGVGGFDTWAPDLVTAAMPAGVTAVLVVGANGPLPWRP